MKRFFTLIALVSASIGFTQEPIFDSWMMNTDGTLASYEYYPAAPPTTVTVNMTDSADVLEVCYNTDYVYVRCNNLASYMMGPWLMNPNVPTAQPSIYRIPRNPAEETGVKESQPWGGALGIAINGIKLYGAGDARSYQSSSNSNQPMGDGIWNGDAWASEGGTMDATGTGHPDGQGNYHYHATPIFLYSSPSTTHSPIIGWSFDGFPIYGPYGYDDPFNSSSSVVRIETSYQLRTMADRTTLPDGSPSIPAGPSDFVTFPLGTYQEDYEYINALGHLDEYNGRWCVTPEFPDSIYAYFITMDGAGDPAYPYITGSEYYGQVIAGDIGGNAGNNTIPAGVTCLEASSSIVEEELIQLTAYPNPTYSNITISNAQGAEYKVYDQLGREVLNGIIIDEIYVGDLSKGTYIIHVMMDNQTGFVRIIKE